MAEQRSPLKDAPLRTPGQSCEERRQQIFDDKLELPIIAAVASVALTALEVWRSYASTPPAPGVYAIFAGAAVVFLFIRIRRYVPEMRNLKHAADGEKVVGQYLERLRSEGYDVFHDIPAKNFNVDHVLIGPAGIFTVETKTWGKPVNGDARIQFDGETLLKGGLEPQRNPIVQARAQATWLSRELQESTGRSYEVRPVVLFPGWFVENAKGALDRIWVLEPKALPAFLDRAPRRLAQEEVRLASYHLSRYVRTFGRAADQ